MGCMPKRNSASIYDKPCPVNKDKKSPNPNPENFEVKAIEKIGDFYLITIFYPDCTTFEGMKILVYYKIDIKKLLLQKSLDPHFSMNKKFISPVARFEPTRRGIEMAISFCQKFY
jgi:hypothetical protein